MSEKAVHHEFCVLCAKPEELRELMKVFGRHFAVAKGLRRTDQAYIVHSPDGDLRLLATTCAGMGHMQAAVRTAQVIALNQPDTIIFVGTAASLKPKEVQIGDVVIPRKAFNRIYEKVSEKGQSDFDLRTKNPNFRETFLGENALIADVSAQQCSADAMGAVAALDLDKMVLEGGTEQEIVVGGETFKLRSPKVHDDIDIFSCGMVVDSVSYRSFISEITDLNMRKAGAIDMESYGFFAALDGAKETLDGRRLCEGVMIRGISDYAGRKQQTEVRPEGWKEKAVRNAAVVAAALVQVLADPAAHRSQPVSTALSGRASTEQSTLVPPPAE